VSGQHHAPAALYPWGKDPRYPFYRRLGRRKLLDSNRTADDQISWLNFLVVFLTFFVKMLDYNILPIQSFFIHYPLQPKSGLGLLYWGSITIMLYSVRLLASRPTPVNFGRLMIFCWGLLPWPKVPVLRRWKPALHPTLTCCTTHCALPLDHHEEAESLGLLAEPAGWIHRKLSGI
jgi:hypothetical protein